MHLFCAGCKIFQETPSLLRWETARGSKRTAGNNPACPPLPFRNPNRFGSIGPPQHYEISSRHGSLGLPQHLEISSRLSGASALQSRGAFSRPQAHSFAYPRNAEESLAQAQLGVLTPPCSDTGRGRAVPWPSGPKFFPQGWDSEHSHRARDPRGTLEVLPACVPAAGGQGRSPPPEPNQGVAPTPARASTSPCQRVLEKLTEQQKGRALRGRKRKAPKGLLWASTRRRRAAHRERQLQLSNSLFWLSWQPLRSEPLGHQEEVVPTPPSLLNAPEAQVSQGACSSPPRPSACTTKLIGGARVARYLSKTPLKAPGPDGWTAPIARALSDEQCHQLAGIMRQAELSGSFPAQWAVSLVVLLPKNSEIERPIALMHLLLKAWMKLRWPLLEQWQKGFAAKAWWDSCGPGFSCLDVAVRPLSEYECTHSVSEHRIILSFSI